MIYEHGRNDPAAEMTMDVLTESFQQNRLDGRLHALLAQPAHAAGTVVAVSALFRKHGQLLEGHLGLPRQLLRFPYNSIIIGYFQSVI